MVHLTAMLNCIAEGVFAVDADKRIVFFNRAAVKPKKGTKAALCGTEYRQNSEPLISSSSPLASVTSALYLTIL